LGYVYSLNNNSDLAIENYKKALELNPNCYAALVYMGDCYKFNGNYALAEENYKKAASLNKKDRHVLYPLGSINIKQKDKSHTKLILGMKNYESALTFNPSDSYAEEVLVKIAKLQTK